MAYYLHFHASSLLQVAVQCACIVFALMQYFVTTQLAKISYVGMAQTRIKSRPLMRYKPAFLFYDQKNSQSSSAQKQCGRHLGSESAIFASISFKTGFKVVLNPEVDKPGNPC